jgi:hypothetical protein
MRSSVWLWKWGRTWKQRKKFEAVTGSIVSIECRNSHIDVSLPGRFRPHHFVIRTGVTQVHRSQYGPIPRWKRPASLMVSQHG